MPEPTARRFLIKGRVQGVFFRARTQDEARRLGLRGSAVNRPDGSVEVLAVGPVEAIDALAAWLQKGPTLARVKTVESVELAAAEVDAGVDFVTG